MIAAQDDPVVPFSQFSQAVLSTAVRLKSPKHGGHMGFVTTGGPGWLDQQITDWIVGPT